MFPSLLKAWHYCFGVLKQDLSHQIILVVLSTLEAFKISMVQIIGLGVSIVLMLILNIVIKKTKIGKAIRAVSMSTERQHF